MTIDLYRIEWICHDCLKHIYPNGYEETSAGTGCGDCSRCHNCWRESTYDYSKPTHIIVDGGRSVYNNRWTGPEMSYLAWPPGSPERIALAAEAAQKFREQGCTCSDAGLCDRHIPRRAWRVRPVGEHAWVHIRSIDELDDYRDDDFSSWQVDAIMMSAATLDKLPEFDGW